MTTEMEAEIRASWDAVEDAACRAFLAGQDADYAHHVIPVTIEEGADISVCRTNLHRFAATCRTHTGLAGSGSNWDFSLVETGEGWVVTAVARHSIAD